MFAEWTINQMTPQSPGFWLILSLVSSLIILVLESLWPKSPWRSIWAGQRILIPYLGLVLGGLSPRLLGLSQLDWTVGLGIGLVLIFAVTMLLLLVRATVDLPDASEVRRNAPPPTQSPTPQSTTLQSTTSPTGVQLPGASPFLLDGAWWRELGRTVLITGSREFHWVFLRGALWEIFLVLPNAPTTPGYWAIWLAAALVLLELLLRRLSFAHTIFQLVILICTSILFFYTLNFLLCWALHTIAQIIVAPQALRRPLPRVHWGARQQ